MLWLLKLILNCCTKYKCHTCHIITLTQNPNIWNIKNYLALHSFRTSCSVPLVRNMFVSNMKWRPIFITCHNVIENRRDNRAVQLHFIIRINWFTSHSWTVPTERNFFTMQWWDSKQKFFYITTFNSNTGYFLILMKDQENMLRFFIARKFGKLFF